MDKYIELAKNTIKHYVTRDEVMAVPVNLPPELYQKRAGVFVSLHQKKDESLRGCIGTFLPTKINLAQEIMANAIAASTQDPRFQPVDDDELNSLAVKVDVLSEPELIPSTDDLDPKKYGLIVRADDGRAGLLLPDLPGVDAIEQQYMICCQKGGINPDKDAVKLYRFTVERHQ